MAGVVQFGRNAKAQGATLDPALKEFLDEIFIPALVEKYLKESKNHLAPVSEGMTQSLSMSASAEGVR